VIWRLGSRPGVADTAPTALFSCGYWRRSNGRRAGQRPGGRRLWLAAELGFRGWGPGCGGGPGARSGTRLRFRRSQARAYVPPRLSERSNYASDQCPRQDSNLRSRLRRPILCEALTWQNAPHPCGWELPSFRTTTERSHPRDLCSRAFVHVRATEARQAAGACLYVAVESRASVFPGGTGMSVSGDFGLGWGAVGCG
jgi:hypothetical protein